jgi:hypothetical protein
MALVGKLLKNLKRMSDHTPLIGCFSSTSLIYHKEAAGEFFTTMVLAFVPIWLGGFIMLISAGFKEGGLDWTALAPLVNHGELFIISASVVAPVMYIVTRDQPSTKKFHSKYYFIVLTQVLVLIAAGLITLQRVDSSFAFSRSWIVVSSIACGIALVLRFAALAYRNSIQPNPVEEMRKNTNDDIDALVDHMGGDPN